MSLTAEVTPEVQSARFEGLLRAANAIAACCDCDSTCERLTNELHNIVAFDYLQVVAFESGTTSVEWQLTDVRGKRENGSFGISAPNDSPILWVHEHGQPLVIDDWSRETQFPQERQLMLDLGIASTCVLPLTRGSRRLGVLSFGSSIANSYPEDEAHFLSLVAGQIALAVDAAVNFYSSQRAQEQLKLILDLTNRVVSNLDFDELLRAISANVRQVMQCEAAAIMLPDSDGKHLRVHALDFPEARGLFTKEALIPIEGTLPGDTFRTGKSMVVNRLDR
ncbi:MAG: transcriptional regulator, NifA subfamily, Fis Family, partial [Acidobacteriaceae bacterium]|nr:transcriptional regulator, NifA subfamily, Fis Family [Acidobacteriaceae bacterium]